MDSSSEPHVNNAPRCEMSEIDRETQSQSKVRSYQKGWHNLTIDTGAETSNPCSPAKPVNKILEFCSFESLGDFLVALFYSHSCYSKDPDPQTSQHQSSVTNFLQGSSEVKMGHIINLIYRHQQSRPTSDSLCMPTSSTRVSCRIYRKPKFIMLDLVCQRGQLTGNWLETAYITRMGSWILESQRTTSWLAEDNFWGALYYSYYYLSDLVCINGCKGRNWSLHVSIHID
jgi:hypothetical protein